MTNIQEAKLAREAEICFATLALSTDYDCWNEAVGNVEIEQVLKVLQQNVELAQRTILHVVKALADAGTDGCESSFKDAIIKDSARNSKNSHAKVIPS